MRRKNVREVLVTVTVLSLLIFTATLFAGEKGKQQYPIDTWMEKCIASDSTTAGMTECALKAMEMWDREMNKIYKELLKKLPEKQRVLLKQSQIQWIKFRDAESNFATEFYGGFDGTIWRNISAGEKLNIVKERALGLQNHLNSFEYR